MFSQPKVNLQITSGAAEAQLADQKILFVGQKLAAGTAVAKALTSDIQIGEEDTLFGTNSILSMMIKTAREHNVINQFDAIALNDNGAGSKATATIAITGTATATSDYKFQIGKEDFEFSVTVTTGDANTVVAAALAAAITAGTAPFSASATLGDVTVTFDHGGTAGNEIQTKLIQGVAGITTVITDFAGGAGAVDTAGIFDTLTERYQGVVYSQDLDQDELTDFLEARFNVDNAVLDGEGFITKTGDLATRIAAVELENFKTLVTPFNLDEMLFFEFSTNITAEFVAKRARRLSEGASIADLVIDAVEAIGGPSKASLPYFNIPMDLPLPTGRLTQVQIDNVVDAGGALFLVNPANQVVTGEFPTTYKTDAGGTNDPGFKYLNYVDTASVAREYFFINLKQKYAQTRATAGDLVPGKSMSNVASVRAFIIEKYGELADDAITVFGDDAAAFFDTNLTVTLDAPTGVYTFFARTPLVVQARGFNGILAIQFDF